MPTKVFNRWYQLSNVNRNSTTFNMLNQQTHGCPACIVPSSSTSKFHTCPFYSHSEGTQVTALSVPVISSYLTIRLYSCTYIHAKYFSFVGVTVFMNTSLQNCTVPFNSQINNVFHVELIKL